MGCTQAHRGTIRSIALVILLTGAGVLHSQEAVIDVPALRGQTRAQLQPVFPGKLDGLNGWKGPVELNGWQGWKQVRLDFNSKGLLVVITFTPNTPMTEAEATDILTKRFRIALPQSAYAAFRALRGWRNMPGPIRTVNLVKAPGPGYLVSYITIHFDISY